MNSQPDTIIEVVEVSKGYRLRRNAGSLQAVDGVSFSVHQGECLGIVGESGSGKTTLARLLVALEPPSEGSVRIGNLVQSASSGNSRSSHNRKQRAAYAQMVFQNPRSSLDPMQSITTALTEAIARHSALPRAARLQRAFDLLRLVGLSETEGSRKPPSLSGGQQQRAAIARALAVDPAVLVLDEPFAALDVSIQAQMIDLLREIRARTKLTLVLISHDLSVVRELATHVLVMYRGRTMEYGSTADVFGRRLHPYTQLLFASIPRPNMTFARRSPPRAFADGAGCRFRSRCDWAFEKCAVEPQLLAHSSRHQHVARCWLVEGHQALHTAATLEAN